MAFDPDAYLAGDFDPDKYLNSFDPDKYLAKEPDSVGSFLRESTLGNIPAGILKGGDLALRGLDSAAAAAMGLFGQDETRDKILRESDERSRSTQQFISENFGQGRAAQLGQGIGAIPSMVNPATGVAAAVGGITDVQRTLDEQGVDPETAAEVARRQAIANTATAALPFAKLGVAGAVGTNVGGGFTGDYLSQRKLQEKGYSEQAANFDPLDPVQRAVDVLGGAAGASPKPVNRKIVPAEVRTNLDALDKQKEIQKQTQGEGTLYVGKDGDVTTDLPAKVEETPGQLDLARTELQNRLQDQATTTEGQDPQLSFFDEDGRVVESQLDLGLRTEPATDAPLPAVNASKLDTPEFKQWFGESKVKDSSGKPLVLYHGMPGQMVGDSFNPSTYGTLGPGVYFTTDPSVSSSFATELRKKSDSQQGGPNNIPVYLKMEIPFDDSFLSTRASWRDWFIKFFDNKLKGNELNLPYNKKNKEYLLSLVEKLKNNTATVGDLFSFRDKEFGATSDSMFNEELAKILKEAGFDGIIAKGHKRYDEYLVFNKNQIKSVFNKGTFDNSPNISLSDKTSDTAVIGDRFKASDIPTFKNKQGESIASPEDVLTHLSKVAPREMMRDLAVMLPKVKNLLARFGEKHGIEVVLNDAADFVPARTSNGSKDVPAFYDPVTHKIVLGRSGMQNRVFVHELIHAMTVRYTEAFPDAVATKQIKALFDEIKNHPDFKDLYGTTDIHEFMSEAFSSPTFKARLTDFKSSVVNQFNNAYEALVSLVGKIFGAKTPAEKSALLKLLDATEQVIKGYAADPFTTNKRYTSLLKAGQLPSQQTKNVLEATGTNPNSADSAKVKVTDPETVRADQVEKISGEIYLSKDPVIDDALINKIKQEKDGSNVWALTPGALARSELAQSTLVKTVYRLYNNAFKRADFKNRNVIQPVERSISKLINSGENGRILHDVLMRELKNKTDYTADELRSAGVSDNVIMAHLEFRAMMQEALEAQNAARIAKGLKPITAQEAYISARWSGPWRANIKDSEGKTVWQVAEHSKAEAKRAIDYILSKEKNLTADDVKYKKGMEKGDGLEASYLDMLELLDADDPRIDTLRSIYEEYIQGTTEDVANQEKHFKRKTGVRGFAGDRPWAKNDTKEFFIQQFDYAKNAFKWAESQAATEKAAQLLNNPELLESQKNNISYSKEYAKNQLGYGTAGVFDAIDNSIAEAIGRSPGVMQQALGTAKNFFYLTKLSMSFPFMATQFLQPAITTPAWHAQLDSLGYKHNPALTTLRGIGAGASAALWHYAPDKFHRNVAEKAMSPLELEATKYLEANAIIDINPLSDIKKELRAEAVKKLTYVPEQTLRIPEVVARSVAFMSFVSHLQQSGKYDTKSAKGRMALFEKAEEMTSLSMTDYRAQERAIAFERGGLTGDAAATLHAYQLNNLMQLTKFFKEAGKGNVKPLATMVGMQALAAGAIGLWFVEDLDDLYQMLISFLPDKEFMEAKKFSPKTVMLNNLDDWVAYGAISTISGTNIQTRMKASDQLPDIFQIPPAPGKVAGDLFPFAESVWDTVKLLGMASPSATPNERWQDFYKAAPVGLQGPMESLPAFNRGGVSLKPSDLSEGKIIRTPEEKSLRNIGMKSLREQRQTEQDWQMTKAEMEISKRMRTASEKAKEFFVSGDTSRGTDQLIKYVNLGGDPQVLLQGVDDYAIKQLTTELQRRQIKASAGTLPAVLKLQRYLEFHGNPTNR
jgi:hypothetical protein